MDHARLSQALKDLLEVASGLPVEAPREPFCQAVRDLLRWLDERRAGQLNPPAEQLEPGMGAEHPLKILVADDVAVNQRLTSLLLSRLGYRADLAKDGLDVLRCLEQADYDLILMDLNMPEMDGLEATRRIRARRQVRQPRVVAMSAHRPENESWFDEFLAKPIQLHQLKATLRRCPSGPVRCADSMPATVTAEAVLDEQTVQALYELGSPDFFASLVEDAREEWPRALAELRLAFETQNVVAVIAQAHQIKGSALALGARRLAGLAAQIESSARTGQCAFQLDQVSSLQKLARGALDQLGRVQCSASA